MHSLKLVPWVSPYSLPRRPMCPTSTAASLGLCSCSSTRHQPRCVWPLLPCAHSRLAPPAVHLPSLSLSPDTYHLSPLPQTSPGGDCAAIGEHTYIQGPRGHLWTRFMLCLLQLACTTAFICSHQPCLCTSMPLAQPPSLASTSVPLR